MTSSSIEKPVRIAIIGAVALLPDGSLTRSGALAIALAAHAHVEVTLRAIAPDDATCTAIAESMANHETAIHTQVTVRADGDPAPIRLGDTLDIWGLFAHDLVILDADDAPLRAWLTDLPAHTAPNVRILGTLDYVTGDLVGSEVDRDIARRFDAMIGTLEQAESLFGLQSTDNVAEAAEAIGAMMRGANLRTAAIHGESMLAIVALDEPTVTMPLPECASREAIITAVAVAMARRAAWLTVVDLLQP